MTIVKQISVARYFTAGGVKGKYHGASMALRGGDGMLVGWDGPHYIPAIRRKGGCGCVMKVCRLPGGYKCDDLFDEQVWATFICTRSCLLSVHGLVSASFGLTGMF
jgi:hypothetical protein